MAEPETVGTTAHPVERDKAFMDAIENTIQRLNDHGAGKGTIPPEADVESLRCHYRLGHLHTKHLEVNEDFPLDLPLYEELRSCKTSLQQLTRTCIRNLSPGVPAMGQYLLLRSLEPATKFSGLLTIVEDHRGSGTYFHACNVTSDVKADYKEILPVGTVFALKEPLYRLTPNRYELQCDCSTDIVMLQPGQKYSHLTKDIKWRNSIECWPFPDLEYTKRMTALEWKDLAKKMYYQGSYLHATRFYLRGLLEAKKVKDEELCKTFHLNLAAVYLTSGWYEAAITAAGKVLEVDPTCLKAHLRVGRAKYALRKYEESKQCFLDLLRWHSDCAEAKSELQRCENRIREAETGNHDMHAMTLAKMTDITQPIDCADYVGPVQVVDISSKERRVVATRDLQPGTVLVVSKALHMTWGNHQETDFRIRNVFVPPIADIILKNPRTFGNVVYDLPFAKQQNSTVTLSEPANVFCDPDRMEEPIVDMARLFHVVKRNSFYFSKVQIRQQPEITPLNIVIRVENQHITGSGLFLFPSYFKRACIANAWCEIYNDVMVVRSVQPVRSGEEISIYRFMGVDFSYARRTEAAQNRHLWCDCRLCFLDGKEPSRIGFRRQILMDTFHAKMAPVLDRHPIVTVNILRKLQKLIWDVKSTYRKSDRAYLQVDLYQLYVALAKACILIGEHDDLVAQCYQNALRIWGFDPRDLLRSVTKDGNIVIDKEKFLNPVAMQATALLVNSYLLSGNIMLAKKWVQVLIQFEKILCGMDLTDFKLKYDHFTDIL